MSRCHCVFVVGRSSTATSDAADRVQATLIKGSGSWLSGNLVRRGMDFFG
jgi:hypothetical protein